MADEVTGTVNAPETQQQLNGVQPPAQTPSAPSIDPNEFERYKGSAMKYEEFSGRLKKHEIDDLSDDDLLVLQRIRQSKLPHQDLLGAIGTFQEESEKALDTKGLTQRQIEEMIDKRTEERFNRQWGEHESKSKAQREHEAALAEQNRYINEIRQELGIGEQIGEDDLHGQLMEDALRGRQLRLMSQNGFYPDEHPLKGSARPLTPESIKAMREFFGKAKDFTVARKQIEDAKKAVRTSTTGSPGTGGETTKKDSSHDDPAEAERKQIAERLNQRRKARGASTMSTSV